MSYLVMARKWRPKNFDEMVGQEHIAKTLRNAIESGRIAHAFLFTGTRGVGKTTAARILAKALNCVQGPIATPCGTCENCLAVDQGASMDVLEIDGASNNGVENVRELREQVKYAPMHGAYKVYIIDEVHMLSKSAFNALLKTLEEPPPHVAFIFATTESAKVPHTILSRVQRFDFRRISESAIRDRLEFICAKENIRADTQALEVLARKADGSMRDALSLLDRVNAYAAGDLNLDAARKSLGIPEDRLYDDLLRRLCAHDSAGCLATLGEVYQQGLELSEFLLGFGEYLRDLLFSRQEGVSPALLGLGEARFREMRSLAASLQDGDLIRYAKIVSDLLSDLKFAPHPRLWVELGMARMAALDRVVLLSQLLESTPGPAIAPNPALTPAPENPEAKKKSPERLAPAPPEDAEEAAPDASVLSLVEIPVRWAQLVGAFSKDRPFAGGPLHQSRVALTPGDPAVLSLAFAGSGARNLFLADGENKKILRNHLAARLRPGTPFILEFAAPEAVEASGQAALSAPNNSRTWIESEPIVKTLLEMFEGRVLDASS